MIKDNYGVSPLTVVAENCTGHVDEGVANTRTLHSTIMSSPGEENTKIRTISARVWSGFRSSQTLITCSLGIFVSYFLLGILQENM